jgi:hypothetical protein
MPFNQKILESLEWIISQDRTTLLEASYDFKVESIAYCIYHFNILNVQLPILEEMIATGRIKTVKNAAFKDYLLQLWEHRKFIKYRETQVTQIQYERIDPYLDNSFPVVSLKKHVLPVESLKGVDLKTTAENYDRFITLQKTQNLAFVKYAETLSLKDDYSRLLELIEKYPENIQ